MHTTAVKKSIRNRNRRQNGFSLFELLTVIAILGIMVSIAIPSYDNYVDKKNVTLAERDILELQKDIDKFYVINNRFPETLTDIGKQNLRDPWGNQYFYINMATYDKKTSEIKVRKDKKLKPVNSDYDLYSAGKDKMSKASFSAGASQDDIVRCNNGGYLGFVKDY